MDIVWQFVPNLVRFESSVDYQGAQTKPPVSIKQPAV